MKKLKNQTKVREQMLNIKRAYEVLDLMSPDLTNKADIAGVITALSNLRILLGNYEAEKYINDFQLDMFRDAKDKGIDIGTVIIEKFSELNTESKARTPETSLNKKFVLMDARAAIIQLIITKGIKESKSKPKKDDKTK